ncbi:MAG: hypothetical protein U0736_13970 [Gemmataceae bacterium]
MIDALTGLLADANAAGRPRAGASSRRRLVGRGRWLLERTRRENCRPTSSPPLAGFAEQPYRDL